MKNENYIRKNALIYSRYKDKFSSLTSLELEQFQNEVEQAFTKVPVKVEFVAGQPYANHKELTQDIEGNKVMLISTDFNDSKLLPNNLNLKFRAVHDWLHYVLQTPFTTEGEIKVYKIQKKHHKVGLMQDILFSEVVLQACFCEYFGSFAPAQKLVLFNR
jgi:hypothetical protein